jgi:uncharacterized protein YndB with AHSA1/START domain
MHRIEKTVIINAPRTAVWEALTNPRTIREWMGEPGMPIEIDTDWSVGGPIVISGFHHVRFRNSGTVLSFEPERELRYTHLSSLSGLADEPGNHTVIAFELASAPEGTSLTLTVDNFPDEVIFRHMDLYWRTTMELLGKFIAR